jgi:ribonuclease HI
MPIPKTHAQPASPASLAEGALWQAWCDGTACPNPGQIGLGAVLHSPSGNTYPLSQRAPVQGCNNEAEALAVLATLELAQGLGARQLRIHCDSDVVVRLAQDSTSTEATRLAPLFAQLRECIARFEHVELKWLPQHRNSEADQLARQALGLPPRLPAKPRRKKR